MPPPPANNTTPNESQSNSDSNVNGHGNGVGGNDTISDVEGWENAGESIENDNTMNNITPVSDEPEVPDQPNSDGATSGLATPNHVESVPATADHGSVRPPRLTRKAARTQQLLSNLRPRINGKQPAATGVDTSEQASATTSGDI